MKNKKLLLLFNTIRYLKIIQIYYRLFYNIRTRLRKLRNFENLLSMSSSGKQLKLSKSLYYERSFEENKFIFLNISQHFKKKINWNYSKYGKLWIYNLTYFEYLNQRYISKQEGVRLINDFIEQSDNIKDGFEPFPVSLRTVNWIKFLVEYNINDIIINDSLYAQYHILMDNIEYHLLGNHLLENGFSLLFGAYYFQDEKFYIKAKKILTEELEEQILKDGAHFELSSMYHQLMLFRVLDCINLVHNNNWKNQELLDLLINKAEIMFGWLNAITYENGNIPLLNDSANKIAPTTRQLNDYANDLNLKFNIEKSTLSDSGYRKVKNECYEMILDVGNIGPDYIPGHAHSDTFNFELYIRDQPVIVDTGLSTYETNERRQLERSTMSHNTVVVDGDNQSQVWGGFRVAKRAKIAALKEFPGSIEATHDGYKDKGVWHTRKFIAEKDHIIIKDSIKSKKEHSCVAYLHFHPDIQLYIESEKLISELFSISCIYSCRIELIDYEYAPEFNTKINAKCAIITFQNKLKMNIRIKEMNENN